MLPGASCFAALVVFGFSSSACAQNTLTAVLSRRLTTASKFDVQFNNLDAEYPFGIATFDNAQVRHAFHTGAIKLRFAK